MNTSPKTAISKVTERQRSATHARTKPSTTSAQAASFSQSEPDAGSTIDARSWGDTPIGQTGSLISVGSVDPQGRWVYFCQTAEKFDESSLAARSLGARSAFLDHAFSPHFARRNAQGVPSDALLASSPDGRYVVLTRNQNPELVDVEADTVLSLSSRDIDMRSDGLPGDLRSIAFSPKGDRLALLVHPKQPRVVILNLRDASEVEVIPVTSVVWRIAFDASGQYLVLWEVPEDTNRNGKVTWPFPEKKLADTRCRTPIPAFAAFTPTGDEAQTSIASVAGGHARSVPGFITGLGHSVVVKAADGALTEIEGSRTSRFGSRNCDAQVVAIAPEHGRILVGCRDANGRARLEIDGLSSSQELEIDVPYSSVDRLVAEPIPYTVVYSGAQSALIDWASARVFPLQDRDQVLAQGQAGVVVRRGSKVVLHVPSSGRSLTLIDNVSAGVRIVFGSNVVVVGNAVVSAKLGRVLGTLDKPALAIDSNGCGLVSLNGSKTERFARGPLGWQCPATSLPDEGRDSDVSR